MTRWWFVLYLWDADGTGTFRILAVVHAVPIVAVAIAVVAIIANRLTVWWERRR